MQRSPDTNIEKPILPKRFHNGWTNPLEVLAAEWADKAACYQWMHEKTETICTMYNLHFSIPVIVLSTLTGTANFGLSSLIDNNASQKYVSAAIGVISIITGIISTLANFLRYAQASEAHRVAAISWGKFQRFTSTELSLHPNERMDAMSYLKMARMELDRLIEQSPVIPDNIIQEFLKEFKSKPDLIKPEIAGGVDHTRIFKDNDSRFSRIVSEALFMLQQKRTMMQQMILDDLDKKIASKTREEREAHELELMSEVVKVARETVEKTINSTTDKSPPKIKPSRSSSNHTPPSPNSITLEIIDKS